MILVDNINFLRQNYRDIRELLNVAEEKIDNQSIEVISTRSGLPTIQVSTENRVQLIHSKYDPVREAEKFVEQFADKIQHYDHVFFYGVGLGYHVEAFLRKYPNLSYTLYEPNPYVFYHYVSQKKLSILPLSKLKHIHVEKNELDMKQFLQQFSEQLNEKVLLVSLPSYEKIFKQQYEKFFTTFKEVISDKKSGFHTNLAFEKRWTINSIINLPTTIQTPNILHDIDKDKFKGKPAIIVSAGPSLAEEIENLRYIKENGLAYIFSVGSAINALIEYGIYPDAACTYDPTPKNQIVFEKMVTQGIDSIPLIYGTSVGFETLKKYLGPKIHMITSQDTVSPYYLNYENDIVIDKVNDAPSIAVVTLQLLYKLGCNPIILVGQNLAYKDKKLYSKGIEYTHISSTINENELKSGFKVESVDGGQVLTNEGFNRMRMQMEMYIKAFDDTTFINTTIGGAKIQGTIFEPLEQVIIERLKNKSVESDWYHSLQPSYSIEKVSQKQKKMDVYLAEFQLLIERLSKSLVKLENLINAKLEKEFDRLYNKIDKEFKKFTNNEFYKVFIAPMVRVQFELAAKNIQSVRFEKDAVKKANEIKNTFAKFIYDCKKDVQIIIPLYEQMKNEIYQLTMLEEK